MKVTKASLTRHEATQEAMLVVTFDTGLNITLGGNSGHGHLWRRPDGSVARCGGPGVCDKCREHAEIMDAVHRWPCPIIQAALKAMDLRVGESKHDQEKPAKLENAKDMGPNNQLIQCLEILLEEAKKGEVRSMAFAVAYDDMATSHNWVRDKRTYHNMLLGEIDMLHQNYRNANDLRDSNSVLGKALRDAADGVL